MFCFSVGQNSCILSYKYWWHSTDRPVGGMTEESWFEVGLELVPWCYH